MEQGLRMANPRIVLDRPTVMGAARCAVGHRYGFGSARKVRAAVFIATMRINFWYILLVNPMPQGGISYGGECL